MNVLTDYIVTLICKKKYDVPKLGNIYKQYDNDSIKTKKYLTILIQEFNQYHSRILAVLESGNQKEWNAIKHKIITHINSLKLNQLEMLFLILLISCYACGEDGTNTPTPINQATINILDASVVEGSGNSTLQFEVTATSPVETAVSITFNKPILTDRLRLAVFYEGIISVNEFEIYGQQYVSEDATPVRKIVINQSGYNLEKPKRFTAPEIEEVIHTTRAEFEEGPNSNRKKEAGRGMGA